MSEQAMAIKEHMAGKRTLLDGGNAVLRSLTPADQALLQPHLQPVTLKFRQRLEIPKRRIRDVYFPERGLASVIVASSGGQARQAEAAIIGREGMTGLAVVLGLERSVHETLMQVGGSGQCIATEDLRGAMARSPSLTALLLRFAYAYSVQVAYSVLAGAQGRVEERLARWLLMAHDRMDGDDLALTHEFLSVMLGVRRSGVTTALHELEARALISTARGVITVLDRCGLESNANGLYGAPEEEFERLFGSM